MMEIFLQASSMGAMGDGSGKVQKANTYSVGVDVAVIECYMYVGA